MKKILITNNCLGGCVYRDCVKIPQPSPFTWNIIQQEDFIKLIENIDTINLLNFKVKFEPMSQEYYVLIDNLIKIFYTHYKYDPNAEERHVTFVPGHGNMINCKNILEFISDQYLKRVNRLLELKKSGDVKFIFYYDAGGFQSWTEPIDSYITRKYDELSELVKVDTRHTVCVGYWQWDFLNELKAKNEKILYFPKPCNENGSILEMQDEAQHMYDNYFKDLMNESTETE